MLPGFVPLQEFGRRVAQAQRNCWLVDRELPRELLAGLQLEHFGQGELVEIAALPLQGQIRRGHKQMPDLRDPVAVVPASVARLCREHAVHPVQVASQTLPLQRIVAPRSLDRRAGVSPVRGTPVVGVG